MQISISGQHVQITNKFRKYVGPKLVGIDQHFSRVARSHIAYHRGSDMDAIINRVVNEVDRQARIHKEKVVGHYLRRIVD